MSGFDQLGEQILAAQSAIELVRDQQPLIENLLKTIDAAGGITPVSDDTVIGRFRADCVLSSAGRTPELQPVGSSA